MTLTEFINKYNGQFCEVTGGGDALNQCVDLVNAYIRDVYELPIIEHCNAQDFPSRAGDNYDYIKNTSTNFPLSGDIVIYSNPNGIGHIGICIEATSDVITKFFDQNWPLKRVCDISQMDYVIGKYKVIGWLRKKNMTQEQEKVLSMLINFKNSNDKLKDGNLEGTVSALIGWANDLKNYSDKVSNQEKKISDLESSINQITTKLDEIESKYAEKQKMELSYQKQLSTANENLSKQVQITADMTTDRDTWRTRYNNKNDSFNNEVETTANTKYQSLVDSTSGIDFIILGFKKLFIKK